jgi:prepilin-type N-terminal cleavage/methylation domain-containing protein
VNERGVTLTELLVALALMLLAMCAAATFHSFCLAGYEGMAGRAELKQHARIAAEELVCELKYARAVWVDLGNQRVRYSKLKGGSVENYMFYLLGKQLMLSLPGGTAVPIANHIESFVAAPEGALGAGEPVTFWVRAAGPGGGVELRCLVWPRNIR